jgi:hypothetical protein
VVFRRGPQGTNFAYTIPEIAKWFDCSKDVCQGPPASSGFPFFGADDFLYFIFKEPEQVHSIEITHLTTRDVGGPDFEIASDIAGDFEVAFTDPTIPNLAEVDTGEILVNGKISAFEYRFAEDEVEVCEVVIKTFQHVENKPPTGEAFSVEAGSALAADTPVDFGFSRGSLAFILTNDDAAFDLRYTKWKLDEAAAPATGTAGRTFRLKPGEVESLDTARFRGINIARAPEATANVPYRLDAW